VNDLTATADSSASLLTSSLPEADVLRERLIEIGKDPDLKDFSRQKAVLALLKEVLADGRAYAQRTLEAGATGVETAAILCAVQDTIIKVLYDYTTSFPYRASTEVKGEKLGIVAVGGYGRGLLAPGSDVDLLFLLPYKQTPWGESVVEYMLYILWDLGLKVGQATRTVDECVKQALADMTIRTTLIDARYLWGDQQLFDDLMVRFEKDVVEATDVTEFIDAKLKERNVRHNRAGVSRFLVEPNIKDGKGGMRDLHTLYWIGKYVYRVDDPRELTKKGLFTETEFEIFEARERFFWDVRCHLHFLAGRAEERLSFDRQPEMAMRLGYEDSAAQSAVERFMTDYFRAAKDVGDLTRIFCAALEWQEKKQAPEMGHATSFGSSFFGRMRRNRKSAMAPTGNPNFVMAHGRMTTARPGVFDEDPVNILQIFALAQKLQVFIHPSALAELRRSLLLVDDALRANEEANKLFLEILTSQMDAERVLRRMHETGVLGAFIPAFGKVEAMMQFNMYHHYTVDEHTLRALFVLSQIDRGELSEDHPLANEIIHKVISRDVLYVAVLLHDIAKGRDGDHSELGAEVARDLCPRLGFDKAETELIAWLVLNHLVFSDYAQTRDINDPGTIQTFCDLIQSPERLRLLLVLTVADIRAVGPGVWNGWKGELLRQLYYEAERVLSGGHTENSREARVRHRQAQLEETLESISSDDTIRFFGRLEAHYWLGLDFETQVRHAHLLIHADSEGDEREQIVLHAVPDEFRDVTQISIYTEDTPGLFASLTGAVAACGGTIADARLFTTTDGMALDVFWVQDANEEGPFGPERLDRLKKMIADTLAQRVSPRDNMPKSLSHRRTAAFFVAPEVIIDNGASEVSTVIEASGLDRAGLLFEVSDALVRQNISVNSAHVATFGERAVGVYYVTDAYGLKITHDVRIKDVRAALIAAMVGSAQETGEAAQ
jgi:[protein-PII] uridylyltransferase